MAINFRDFLQILDEFSGMVGMSRTADVLLAQIGFPINMRPHADSPIEFWIAVARNLEAGILTSADPFQLLLECAQAMFPGNSTIRSVLESHAVDPNVQRDEFWKKVEMALTRPSRVDPHQSGKDWPVTTRNGPLKGVFLSYNSKDFEEVLRIASALRDAGVLPWLDEWHMDCGGRLRQTIEQAIIDASCICVFIGANCLSAWQQFELDAAFALQMNGSPKKIIPVLLSSAPEAILQMPLALQILSWVRFNNGNSFESNVSRLVASIHDANSK